MTDKNILLNILFKKNPQSVAQLNLFTNMLNEINTNNPKTHKKMDLGPIDSGSISRCTST